MIHFLPPQILTNDGGNDSLDEQKVIIAFQTGKQPCKLPPKQLPIEQNLYALYFLLHPPKKSGNIEKIFCVK